MTTIDMLRHPSIRAVLTAAARIEPDLIPSTGLTPRPSFTVRNLPAGISPARAGSRLWRIRAKWHTLTFTFYWEPEPPADEPAVIREAADVLRAAELQAAILRGADDDGPCTILMFNTIHPATGLVHRPRDIYTELFALALRARRRAAARSHRFPTRRRRAAPTLETRPCAVVSRT